MIWNLLETGKNYPSLQRCTISQANIGHEGKNSNATTVVIEHSLLLTMKQSVMYVIYTVGTSDFDKIS
jgi:hypothetical protein